MPTPNSYEKVGNGLFSNLTDESDVEAEESGSEEVVEEPTEKSTEEIVEKEEKNEEVKTDEQVEKPEEKKEDIVEKETKMSREEIDKLKQDLFKDLQTSLTKDQEKAVNDSEDKVESEEENIDKEANYLEMDEEELRDAFFEDPKKVVDSIVANRLNDELAKERQKYEPVVKEYALNKTKQKMQDTVNNFAKEHEDFEQHSENIADILRKEDLDMSKEKSLEYAYYKAKSMGKEQVDASRKTLDEFVSDEDALKQLIDNPKIRDAAIEQYVREVAAGKRDPVTLTDDTGESPMTKNKKSKSFDDISDSLYRKLN